MTVRSLNVVTIVLAAMVGPGCAITTPRSQASALPHFFEVDERLYRGGQPTAEGFQQLAQRGVRTVIDLRAEGEAHRRQEQRLVESLGMSWVYLPMRSYWRPSDAQVLAFLAIAFDPRRQPVFVHCRKGEDRTGALVAVYRIVGQDWPAERAYAEARSLGLAGWNLFMRHVILHEAAGEYALALAPSARGK